MSCSSRMKKEAVFVPFILPKGNLFTFVLISMYSALNTLSELVHEAKPIFSKNMCKLVNNIFIAHLNPYFM